MCSVVIRCRNEEEHIGRLLLGLQAQSLVDHEVIVVDSGSDDSTLSIVDQFDARVVHLKPEAFSFGHSLNLGCDAAQGDIIVIVSAHCYPVYRDWLERLVAPLDDLEVGVVYGKQRGAESTKFSEHRVFERWFPDEAPHVNAGHPFCNNANAAIRRADWVQHPYDEALTGLEDLAWAKAAVARGQRVAYVPEAEIIHVHNESAKQIFNRYRREAMAFARIYPEGKMGVLTAARLFGAHVLNDARVARQQGRLTEVAAEVVEFRGLQMLGTLLGFRERKSAPQDLKRRFYYPEQHREVPRHERNAERVDYSRSRDD